MPQSHSKRTFDALVVDISVILCTFNRATSLRRTLEGFRSLAVPAGCQWELLVADNNSTDDTRSVCEDFHGKLPLRYLFESRPGKSFALNHAVQQASAPLLLFTDDDVDVDPRWAGALVDAARRHPEITFFGGRVLPHWEQPPPRWAEENIDWLLINVHVDKGDAEIVLQNGSTTFLVGANLAVRRSVFAQGLCFREDLGPAGSDGSPVGNMRGEEIDLEKQLLKRGCKGLYVPAAIVRHRHAAHRCTERYLRHWYMGWGMSDVRTDIRAPDPHIWFGAPRYYWKALVLNALKYASARWTRPSRVWLTAEIDMAFAWGVIVEHRRQKTRRNVAR